MIWLKSEFDKNESLVGFLRGTVTCENRMDGVSFVDERKIVSVIRYLFWVRHWHHCLNEWEPSTGNVFRVKWHNA